MTLFYRALWQDDEAGLAATARSRFEAWIAEKYGDDALTGDRTVINRGGDVIEIAVDYGIGDVGDSSVLEVVRASLVETRDRGGSRWETRLRCWTTTTDSRTWSTHGWVWVDVSAVGEDIDPLSLAPAAPRLVRHLLPTSGSAHNNGMPIDTAILRFHGTAEGEGLAEMISSMERKLPLVVFADEEAASAWIPGDAKHSHDGIVSRVSDRIAGIGRVAVADRKAAAAVTDALGESHGVWGGAFRIYMRDVDPAVANDATRHRYVLPARYMHRPALAAHIIARALSPVSAIQRPPAEYDIAKRILDTSIAGNDAESLYQLAQDEADSYRAEVIELREQVNAMTEQMMGQAIDGEAMTETVNSLRAAGDLQARHIEYLQQRLEKLEQSDLFAGSSLAYVSIPTSADSASEAVALARRHLGDHLWIPDGATDPDDLAKLDSANASKAIAANAWHGFRALHAYAKAQREPQARNDSFWTWCENSDDPWKWRATKTSLAMRESDSVRNQPEKRTFPVSTTVSPSGKVYMDKHLKFDTNGEHAPRIYFHVDPDAGLIHVGYFGPHSRLKNSTN
jgi:hypothetical protein